MFSYIKGELTEIQGDAVVLETGGVGFQIRVPGSVFGKLPPVGSRLCLHTLFRVGEDSMQLYGFLTRDDLEVFRLLLGVSGVGPRAALGVLGVLTANELRFAVLGDDAKAIARAPGLGPKTAKKIILELKDKLRLEDALAAGAEPTAAGAEPGVQDEAVQALVALGYSASEALRAVRSVPDAAGLDAEQLLRQALKNM